MDSLSATIEDHAMALEKAGIVPRKNAAAIPQFWRDPALPFIEARYVADGRQVCYAAHSHASFSIGAITAGKNLYINGETRQTISAGTVVLVNPDQLHACNPVDGQAWSYCMLYVDAAWLAQLQCDCAVADGDGFWKFPQKLSCDPNLYKGLLDLYCTLTSTFVEAEVKRTAAFAYFHMLQQTLNPAPCAAKLLNRKLQQAADFIGANCTRELSLAEISAHVALSDSYLYRAFKKQYGMTPHHYLLNRRVQHAQKQLAAGVPIAAAAQMSGFADQAHLQRVFKRMLAATPRQYSR